MILLFLLMITRISWSLDIKEEFKKYQIVPSIIRKAPIKWATLEYPGIGPIITGGSYRPNQLTKTPTLSWKTNELQFYTILLFDPDFPIGSKPWEGVWQCWLVTNVEDNDLVNAEPTVHYQQPHPDNDYKHRVVLLIYEHPVMKKFEEFVIGNDTFSGRNGLNVANFTKKHKLKKLVAGNIFFVDRDAPISIRLSTVIKL